MEEEIKQDECPHCHGKFKNLGSHLRHCKENPEKPADTAPPELPSPKTIISDVQPYPIDPEVDDVAWFLNEDGNRTSKVPSFMGLMTTNSGTLPCLLVTTIDGMLIPPAMIAGFIGMYPKYHEFPAAVEQEKEEEIQPEEPIKPIEQPKIQEEQPERIIAPPPSHAQEQKKKSIFAGIFGKKEAKEKSEIQKSESADLARQIIEAQNGI